MLKGSVILLLVWGMLCLPGLPPWNVANASTMTISQKAGAKRRRSHRKFRRRPAAIPAPSTVTPADLQQLIRSFSNEEIRAELNRRLLTAYPLDQLQAEARRRGIQ